MKKVLALLLTSGCFMFSGCTAIMWGQHSQNMKSTNVYKWVEIDKDTLIVISKQQSDNAIIFQGEKYWFVLDEKSSEKLNAILTSRLKNNLKVVSNWGEAANADTVYQNGLSVNTELEQQTFSVNVRLAYIPNQIPNEQDKELLKSFEFSRQQSKDNDELRPYYLRNSLSLTGKIYQNPQTKKAGDYTLQKSIPIHIKKREKDNFESTSNAIENTIDTAGVIAMTPYTIAGDLVLIPLLFIGAGIQNITQ